MKGYKVDGPNDPKWVAICPKCLAEVSNGAYYAGKNGSAHLRGTCRLRSIYPNMERLTDKPLPYPMPPAVDYDKVRATRTYAGFRESPPISYTFPKIETYSDLKSWWRL